MALVTVADYQLFLNQVLMSEHYTYGTAFTRNFVKFGASQADVNAVVSGFQAYRAASGLKYSGATYKTATP